MKTNNNIYVSDLNKHLYAIDLSLKNLDQFFERSSLDIIAKYQLEMEKAIYTLPNQPITFEFVSYDHIECIYEAETRDHLMQILHHMDDLLYVITHQRVFLGIGIDEIHINDDPMVCMRNAKLARTLSEDAQKLHTHIEWFHSSYLENLLRKRTLEQQLYRAIGTHSLQMVIQPKVSCKDERICGGEALIRMPFSDGMDIDTFHMIALAETNGLIEDIDLFMFEEVCKLQSQILRDGGPLIPISVNISRIHFQQRNFFQDYLSIYKQYELPNHCIELEITEHAKQQDDLNTLIAFIKQAHQAGFLVSLDDFGSGQSTLGLLSRLDIDIIKLDRSFFLEQSQESNYIIEMILELGHKLHITTVAEGIESKDQVSFLQEHGCDMIQGYYYAPPLRLEEFLVYLKEHS